MYRQHVKLSDVTITEISIYFTNCWTVYSKEKNKYADTRIKPPEFQTTSRIATVRLEKDPTVTLSSNLLGFWNACFLAHLWNKWETTDLSSTENLYKGERNQLNYIWERERERKRENGMWGLTIRNKHVEYFSLFPIFLPLPNRTLKVIFCATSSIWQLEMTIKIWKENLFKKIFPLHASTGSVISLEALLIWMLRESLGSMSTSEEFFSPGRLVVMLTGCFGISWGFVCKSRRHTSACH